MQNSMANSNTTYYNELDDLYRQFERTNNEAAVTKNCYENLQESIAHI
jgi:hypothetical protein